jgi:hypothetical protein
MRIGNYKIRAAVYNPSGYGYEQTGGICFLSLSQTGKMSIFSHAAASLPQIVMEMWQRRDITLESVLLVKQEHYLVSDLQENDGIYTVTAVKIPSYRFARESGEEITGFVGEKYMTAPEDSFHIEEQETNILLTNKAVLLSLSDLLTREDKTVWTVKKRYTSGAYHNEYEVVRYGTAE